MRINRIHYSTALATLAAFSALQAAAQDFYIDYRANFGVPPGFHVMPDSMPGV